MWVPSPLEKVWEFMASPQNLAAITPRLFNARVDPKARIENGAEFAIHMRLPVNFEWRVVVNDVVSEGLKRQFVDTQTSRPVPEWRHTHIFEAGQANIEGLRSNSQVRLHEAGTWIRDRLEYGIAMGRAGALVNKLIARRQLEKMFLFRREKLQELFG
jgi:ligand-binding SRPBCC domain-containing protein